MLNNLTCSAIVLFNVIMENSMFVPKAFVADQSSLTSFVLFYQLNDSTVNP